MAAEEAKVEVKAEVKPEAKAPVEKQTNCLSCNKPIRKLKKYYRDGKFYCNKKCWQAFLSKSKEEKK